MGIINSVEANAWRNDLARMPDVHREGCDATTYVCSNCTHDEYHSLWWLWSEHYRVPWEQESLGLHMTIGHIDDRPIVVTAFFADIGLKTDFQADAERVAFVDVTSLLADHDMRGRWERAVFRNMIQHSDVANFGHIISDIEDRHRCEIFDRKRVKAVDQVLEIDSANLERRQSLAILGDLETDSHKAFMRCEQKMLEWGERAKYYQGLMRQDGQDAKGSRKAR